MCMTNKHYSILLQLLLWLHREAILNFEVEVEDVLPALQVRNPTSEDILAEISYLELSSSNEVCSLNGLNGPNNVKLISAC